MLAPVSDDRITCKEQRGLIQSASVCFQNLRYFASIVLVIISLQRNGLKAQAASLTRGGLVSKSSSWQCPVGLGVRCALLKMNQNPFAIRNVSTRGGTMKKKNGSVQARRKCEPSEPTKMVELDLDSAPEFTSQLVSRDTISDEIASQRPEIHSRRFNAIFNGKWLDKENCLEHSCETENCGSASTPMSGIPAISGGATAARQLIFWENMVCGAISRSVAQTIMHPANTMKTILQSKRVNNGATAVTFRSLAHPRNLKMLTRGAGAQFAMSVPHGAINFAVLEYVRRKMNLAVDAYRSSQEHKGKVHVNVGYRKRDVFVAGPGLDFLSSSISTICCSVVSTPQMMISDNIMAGRYSNLPKAVQGLARDRGILGFYSGWWPGLAGKIPSYALTWTFFQQLKAAQLRICGRPPSNVENSAMGCLASGTAVCLMIPMDTIKTRLVTQGRYANLAPYNGIIDAAVRIAREEGIGAFYRGLTPRLLSVVPMIGIQFGVYEYTKKVMLRRKVANAQPGQNNRVFDEVTMEVAASIQQPFPAPYFSEIYKPPKRSQNLTLRWRLPLSKETRVKRKK